MMKLKNRKKVLLAAAASLLICAVSIGSAFAFFSDTASTEAEAEIAIKPGIKTHEEMTGNNKAIQLENTGDTQEYMRVQIAYSDSVKATVSGEGWTQNGNYWYYETAVKPGEKTGTLTVTVSADTLEADTDITVLGECTMHIYYDSENDKELANNASYPGWAAVGDTDLSYKTAE